MFLSLVYMYTLLCYPSETVEFNVAAYIYVCRIDCRKREYEHLRLNIACEIGRKRLLAIFFSDKAWCSRSSYFQIFWSWLYAPHVFKSLPHKKQHSICC